MSARVGVLGVLALCWRVLLNLTQLEAARLLACGLGVLGVLGLTRARACAHSFFALGLPADRPACCFSLMRERTQHT